MAAGNSNYERGTMGVDGHKKTFGGFMGMTVYGGAVFGCDRDSRLCSRCGA